jgi:predicted PurR-regulated permease PerM
MPRGSGAPTVFLVLLGVLALAGLLAILLPFPGSIVLASALSITAYSVYRWLGRWLRLSPTVRALLTNLEVLTLVILPVVLLIWTAAGQADNLRPVLPAGSRRNQAIHEGRLDGSLRRISRSPKQ